ncbi:Hypothetical protein KVN_LOCUS254 [uncultured virus]|nr:Hypothetical protein KVN_LOCUS254 [uncultured virus]
MGEYFVFCWQPKNWVPRAIFIPLNYLDNLIKLEIENLIKYGPIIKEIWQKEGNGSSWIGYLSYDGIPLNENDNYLLSSWKRYADHGFDCDKELNNYNECSGKKEKYKCNCPDYKKKSFIYYINDLNQHLSTNELYEKLKNMILFKDKKFIVKNCVISTELGN